MSAVHIETKSHFDELLKAVSQLNAGELGRLMSEVLSLQAKRNSLSLSEKETELMLKINKGLSSETRKYFDKLNEKRYAETLTSHEYKELLDLIEQIEKTDAERIGYMAELARIRGISLTELMREC